jgi:DMSO/TMAO reductase YedYZ molybdopterin-dependent catalytic subunit
MKNRPQSDSVRTEGVSRREVVKLGLAGLAAAGAGRLLDTGARAAEGPALPSPTSAHPFLTPAGEFVDVSRGHPKPFTLQGEALVAARLTPQTWRLEITADTTLADPVKQPAHIAKSFTLADGTALDMATLLELGKKHSAKFLKAIQCLNIPTPLGQGLWEGVPLRDVLRLCGKMTNVRRIYYWGFHNNDPTQLFQSSLSYTQAMETPPGDLPAFIAYRLNGEPIPLLRGGPVRMIVPWAHGFKSIKWLQQIVLTNDFRANDTYAIANNDPESHLKTAAYLDDIAEKIPAGQPVMMSGLAICGLSGLKCVEYWLRPLDGKVGEVTEGDPVWEKGPWVAAQIAGPPEIWSAVLPPDVSPRDVLGFDPKTGRPATWPLRYSMVRWSGTVDSLAPGKYEVRARAVDLNGFAQPEPRPMQRAGMNQIEARRFEVV